MVLDDRATGFDAQRLGGGMRQATDVRRIGRRADIRAARLQSGLVEIAVDRHHRGVGARFGRGVDHATGRAPEFGGIACGLDVDRLIEVERHPRRADIGVRIGDVQAVDIIGILGHRRAAERRHVAKARSALHRAGRQQGQRGDRTRDRQLRRRRHHVQVQAGGGLGEILADALTGDDDFVGGRVLGRHGHRDAAFLCGRDLDRVALRAIGVALGRELILTRGQPYSGKAAGRRCRVGPRLVLRQRAQRHLDPGHRLIARIHDRAGDRTGGIVLRRRRR